YMKHSRPLDEPVEVVEGRPGFDAAKLCLGEADPAGDNILRDWVAAVVGVTAVGANKLAHVTGGEGGLDGRVVPELGRDVGRIGHAVPAGRLTWRAPTGGVVTGEPRAAPAAIHGMRHGS